MKYDWNDHHRFARDTEIEEAALDADEIDNLYSFLAVGTIFGWLIAFATADDLIVAMIIGLLMAIVITSIVELMIYAAQFVSGSR